MSREDEDHESFITNADRARDWRRQRQEKFTERERHARAWICFQEIAEWLSDLHGRGVPNEAACNHAYDMLMQDLLLGDFEERGRSQVRYLHHVTPKVRMTRR